MLDVSEKLSKIYGQLGPVRYFLTSINANYINVCYVTYPSEVSKDIEVRISEYGPGLFAKNDIEPNATLVKLSLVFKFNLVLSLANQLKLRINLKTSF